MNTEELNAAFAKALGLPKHTTKAVLTLEAGQLPTLQVQCYVIDTKSFPQERLVTKSIPVELAQIQFMLRLEPFRD